MVLLERIELSTSPLPRECSTSELQQRRGPAASAAAWRVIRRKRAAVQGQSGPFFALAVPQRHDP